MGPIKDLLRQEAELQAQLRERRDTVAAAGVSRRLSSLAAEAPTRPGGPPLTPGRRMSLPLRRPGLDAVQPEDDAFSSHLPAKASQPRTSRRPSVEACRNGTAFRRRDSGQASTGDEEDGSRELAAAAALSSKPEQPSEAQRGGDTKALGVDDFYEREQAWREQREHCLEHRRQQRLEEEVMLCTFEPQISSRSDVLARNGRSVERAMQVEERKERVRREMLEKEMAECSFHPDRHIGRAKSQPQRQSPLGTGFSKSSVTSSFSRSRRGAASSYAENFQDKALHLRGAPGARSADRNLGLQMRRSGYPPASRSPDALADYLPAPAPSASSRPGSGRRSRAGASSGGAAAGDPSYRDMDREAREDRREYGMAFTFRQASAADGGWLGEAREDELAISPKQLTFPAVDVLQTGSTQSAEPGCTEDLPSPGRFSGAALGHPPLSKRHSKGTRQLHPEASPSAESRLSPTIVIADSPCEEGRQPPPPLSTSKQSGSIFFRQTTRRTTPLRQYRASYGSACAGDYADFKSAAAGSIRELATSLRAGADADAEVHEDGKVAIDQAMELRHSTASTSAGTGDSSGSSRSSDVGGQLDQLDADKQHIHRHSTAANSPETVVALQPLVASLSIEEEEEVQAEAATAIAEDKEPKQDEEDQDNDRSARLHENEDPCLDIEDRPACLDPIVSKQMAGCAKVPSREGVEAALDKHLSSSTCSSTMSTTDGVVVWFPFEEDEWSPCKLVDVTDRGEVVLKSRSGCVVLPSHKTSLIMPQLGSLKKLDLRMREEPEEEPHLLPRDLSKLQKDGLGPEEVEVVMRSHFCSNLPYTRIADVTLFINPFRSVPIYGEELVEKYASLNSFLPPHIFEVAAQAYKRAVDDSQDQAIVLLGLSGSGKSSNFQHVINFWCQNAGSEELDDHIRALGCLLRPLVSVPASMGKTCWTSTRSVLSVKIGLNEDGFMCSCEANVRLMELARLDRRQCPVGEDDSISEAEGFTFEALHLAYKSPMARRWLPSELFDDPALLGVYAGLEEFDVNGEKSAAWFDSLRGFGIDPEEVVRCLCGLLAIGELAAALDGNSSSSSEQPSSLQEEHGELLECAANALGVHAQDLASALIGERRSDGHLRQRLADTLQDVYGRLIAWILDAANARMASCSDLGQAVAYLSAWEVPATPPPAVDAPAGFDGVLLQWLTEGVRADLLAAALAERSQPKKTGDVSCMAAAEWGMAVGFSSQQQAAEAVAEAFSGHCGLLGVLRSIGSSTELSPGSAKFEEAATALAGWLTEQGCLKDGPVSRRASSVCRVSGAAGVARHRIDGLLAVGALRPRSCEALRDVLLTSPVETVASLAELAPLPTGLQVAEDVVAELRQLLCGEAGVRPWLVCCLRPNDSGSATRVNRQCLLRQVQQLLLPEMVHLSTKEHYSVVWPLRDFYGRYAPLLMQDVAPSERRKLEELLVRGAAQGRREDLRAVEQACRRLVQAHGRGEGTIGSEDVFGTQTFLRLLDAALSQCSEKG
eukprot:TRINITY_DN50825_c0_g2_i1.p1 TRINITY_DN50825_c0_g2~~TRINITY_DN50825_c0_g2_i1.p1  ORF type:complete len:1503 (+),score=406.29 TRINITY_DN50825_c0_g2_i1:212-4720(+)